MPSRELTRPDRGAPSSSGRTTERENGNPSVDPVPRSQAARPRWHVFGLGLAALILVQALLAFGFHHRATAQQSGYSFVPLTPCRVIDTRGPIGVNGGPALNAGVVRSFQVKGLCGVSASAKALALSMVAIAPSVDGLIALWPSGLPYLGTSNLNFVANQPPVASSAIIALSTAPLDMSIVSGLPPPGPGMSPWMSWATTSRALTRPVPSGLGVPLEHAQPVVARENVQNRPGGNEPEQQDRAADLRRTVHVDPGSQAPEDEAGERGAEPFPEAVATGDSVERRGADFEDSPRPA